MNKEIRLVIKLIMKGEHLNQKLKAKALDSLRVLEMEHDEGDAEQVILAMLIDAVEKESADALHDISELIDDTGLAESKRHIVMNDEVEAICIKAGHEFFEKAPNEKERSIRIAMLTKMLEELEAIPLYTDDNKLLFYCNQKKGLLIVGINCDKDKQQLIDWFNKIDQNMMIKLVELVSQMTDQSTSEPAFCFMDWWFIDDDRVAMILDEA